MVFLPREGWKVITVKESVYKFFKDDYDTNKEEYRLKYGISSFSGFITKRLYELMEKDKKKS